MENINKKANNPSIGKEKTDNLSLTINIVKVDRRIDNLGITTNSKQKQKSK